MHGTDYKFPKTPFTEKCGKHRFSLEEELKRLGLVRLQNLSKAEMEGDEVAIKALADMEKQARGL
jgi:ribosomal protein L15